MLATDGSSSATEFIGLMMAMGNTYGVILIICLLGKKHHCYVSEPMKKNINQDVNYTCAGNGLVAVPKNLWQMGQPKKQIERMYLLANSVETALHNARYKLEDVETEVNEVENLFCIRVVIAFKGDVIMCLNRF